MNDELKTDAQKALADSKTVIASLNSDEQKAAGWVKTHTAWAIAIGAFIVGAACGVVATLKL